MTHSRNKGVDLELKVAKAFSAAFGLKIRRTPLSGGWSHENPEVSGDLVCTTPGADFPYCVECKNVEGWKLESLFTDQHKWFDDWWLQTVQECHTSKMPVLVFSKAFAPILAAVKADHWDESIYVNTMNVICRGYQIVIIPLSDLLAYLKPSNST